MLSSSLKRWIRDPYYYIGKHIMNHYPNILPDKWFLSVKWQSNFGYKLNWNRPKTLNEKLQWLKLYDRKNFYTTLVDKYSVKDYVLNTLGADINIIPTLGIYNSSDEIDIDALPNQFVLKCTHDSGSIIICRDKSTFNWRRAKEELDCKLKVNYFYGSREWPYKNVKPRIIAEKYIEICNLDDFRFFCFNGSVRFYKINYNHKKNSMYFLPDHTPIDLDEIGMPRGEGIELENIPIHDMINIAQKLSKPFKFIRVDLYFNESLIYFGELTFYPDGGYMAVSNPDFLKEAGNWLNLS